MKVDIVIVNWNSGAQLVACIGSVRLHGEGRVGSCVVVDNGSHDGSADFLDGAGDVTLLRAGGNLGFARACNLGAARGTSPFLLFLNPDARLMPGSLAVPLEYLQDPEHAGCGIAGIQLIDETGHVARTCARLPTPWYLIAKATGISAVVPGADFHMRDWDHGRTARVDHVIGAFFLVRRRPFERLGGFDERFFVYLEDLDLSKRMAEIGFHSVYLTGARAFHKGGGVSEQVKARRLFYSLRSRILYGFKHFGRLSAASVALATLVVEPLTRAVFLLGRGRLSELRDLGHGYAMLWQWTLSAIARRGGVA